MNQDEINKSWHWTTESNAGKVTILAPPLRVSGLQKPYQYETTTANGNSLVVELNSLIKNAGDLLQCGMAQRKAITHGIRLDVFLLSHKPGFCGDPSKGCLPSQWFDVTQAIKRALNEAFGGDVGMYIEPWNANDKFQARFETYIKYREL